MAPLSDAAFSVYGLLLFIGGNNRTRARFSHNRKNYKEGRVAAVDETLNRQQPGHTD